MAGPTHKNPWGVNSCFIPSGASEPSYISDKWGPEGYQARTFPRSPYIRYPDQVPKQADYDQARWVHWV